MVVGVMDRNLLNLNYLLLIVMERELHSKLVGHRPIILSLSNHVTSHGLRHGEVQDWTLFFVTFREVIGIKFVAMRYLSCDMLR